VILLTGGAKKLTGHAMEIAFPAENMSEDVKRMTDHENFSTGAARIFTVYVK
jgi:hypothetical protein